MPDVAITHLGFLGTRHTALVSADDRGMAFSHLATRGTGALGRAVKTTRILGRYPDTKPPSGKPLKPSTVLAFAPLPLGNVEMATDTMGLTAMLTPYLLVIVSTTPIAETQHKSARPKEVAAHGAMTGCLAWFPAVKLKVPDPSTGSQISKVKLAYCWSNVLTVLDVDELPSEDKDKLPSLTFKARSRWKCEEAIVAVQWLSRSVLTVLTISQRLVVLEDRSMRMTEAFDLIHKHIYHADLFSKQLHALVEQLDEEDTSMHGVVADAFYMSFKAYKGRLFLLGFNDVSLGALSNWADRLIALMENGDYVGAIKLATSYYTGDADKLTIGLPEDTSLRHSMVRDKLLEIMGASLKYAFSHRQRDSDVASDGHFQELAEACFVACDSVGDIDFLFDEMYEWYEDAGVEGIFLQMLEPYILEETISAVPPVVVKALVTYYVSRGLEGRLEVMLCHMDTSTLDLDQTTLLCKQHGLYDALIFIWNHALGDFITPLVDLLTLLLPAMQHGPDSGDPSEESYFISNAEKMFPYLSYILTGQGYPTGEPLTPEAALQGKAEIYWFLFSGKSVTWPRGTQKRFLTRPNQSQEPSFPYLRMILKFDASSFLSTLNEAFEDSFLNDSPDKQMNGRSKDLSEEQIFGLTVDRQYIVSILMEIMGTSDFGPDDTIYLDMFVARNLAKYPQYLLFPGSTLTKTLTGLCNYPGPDLAEDAQLSAEYLLSVYQPPDISALVPSFKQAGFYRILKRIYKVDKQYGRLLQTYFEDPDDKDETFGCIEDCLRPQAGLTRRQLQDVLQVIKDNARELIELDPTRAATTMTAYAPELHRHILDSAADEPELQYTYLKTVLEPNEGLSDDSTISPESDLVEQYVQLMCRYDPSRVSDYVELVESANLRLEKLLPTMEETGVIDAAVVLMTRDGQVQAAMARLTKHLNTIGSAFRGLVGDPASQLDVADLQAAAEDLAQALRKYVLVGIWLCQGQTRIVQEGNSTRRRQRSPTKDSSISDENLWLDLIETSVQLTKSLSAALEASPYSSPPAAEVVDVEDDPVQTLDVDKLLGLIRSLVQTCFTALLTSTSSPPTPAGGGRGSVDAGSNLSFLRILKAFLERAAASSPSLADLRAVLASIFSAYAYEESILRLSNRLLERSLFVKVGEAVELRQRGWRPKGSTCEECGRRVWGPGVAGNVFEAWEDRQGAEQRRRQEHQALHSPIPSFQETGKGKGNEATSPRPEDGFEGFGRGSTREGDGGYEDDSAAANSRAARESLAVPGDLGSRERDKNQALGPLVVLACRHIYHQNCLDRLLAKEGRSTTNRMGHERKYRCPIDG